MRQQIYRRTSVPKKTWRTRSRRKRLSQAAATIHESGMRKNCWRCAGGRHKCLNVPAILTPYFDDVIRAKDALMLARPRQSAHLRLYELNLTRVLAEFHNRRRACSNSSTQRVGNAEVPRVFSCPPQSARSSDQGRAYHRAGHQRPQPSTEVSNLPTAQPVFLNPLPIKTLPMIRLRRPVARLLIKIELDLSEPTTTVTRPTTSMYLPPYDIKTIAACILDSPDINHSTSGVYGDKGEQKEEAQVCGVMRVPMYSIWAFQAEVDGEM